jgi:raffinose/stachyose/melibiose transport system permease protein
MVGAPFMATTAQPETPPHATDEQEPATDGARRPGRGRSDWPVIVLFLVPAMVVIAVYLIWPIAQSIQLSFFRWDGISPARDFVGLANWQRLVADSVFWQSLRNNIVLVIASIGIQLPIAMALAVILDRVGRRLARFLRVLYFVPLLLSTVAIGVLFRNIYDGNFGLLNASLELVGMGGLTQHWLGQTSTALPAVIAVVVWQFVPFYMILFGAALADLPEGLHDAASVDGATENQYFFRVALPQMKPIVGVATVLSLIGSLKYFDVVWVMTRGGPEHATELMATYMFTRSFRTNEVGYGSAIVSALFVTVLLASLISIYLSSRRSREVMR